MKHTASAMALTALFLLPLAIPVALHGQSTRDFSGTWRMDPARSQSAQQGEPFKMVTFVITQSTGQVRIEATRGTEKENVLYPLTTTASHAAPTSEGRAQPEAYWEGDRLITVTQRTVSGQTVTVKEAHRLSPNGADMTVETTVIVQHGYSMPGAKTYGTSEDVFTRAKP
jgi:hypothetical protein